jgi:hypothetical protein
MAVNHYGVAPECNKNIFVASNDENKKQGANKKNKINFEIAATSFKSLRLI